MASDAPKTPSPKKGGLLPPGHYSASARTSPALDPRIRARVGPTIQPEIDRPDRFETFLLGDGENKVEMESETRELLA